MDLKQHFYCDTLSCKMAYAVKGVMRLLQKRLEEEDIKLTLEQYFIISILDKKEGLILKELAEIVHRDKSAVFRHIETMEENRLVARVPDPSDKRRKILLITKPGVQELEDARALEKKVNGEITGNLSNQKVKELEKIVSNIYERTVEKISC